MLIEAHAVGLSTEPTLAVKVRWRDLLVIQAVKRADKHRVTGNAGCRHKRLECVYSLDLRGVRGIRWHSHQIDYAIEPQMRPLWLGSRLAHIVPG